MVARLWFRRYWRWWCGGLFYGPNFPVQAGNNFLLTIGAGGTVGDGTDSSITSNSRTDANVTIDGGGRGGGKEAGQVGGSAAVAVMMEMVWQIEN